MFNKSTSSKDLTKDQEERVKKLKEGFAADSANGPAFERRPNTGAQATVDTQRQPETTTIASDAHIVGDLTGASHLVIKGQIEGNITGQVIELSSGGRHKGDISATSIEIQGHLEGNITADKVTLLENSTVQGNINYGSLAMESGATVIGQLVKQS